MFIVAFNRKLFKRHPEHSEGHRTFFKRGNPSGTLSLTRIYPGFRGPTPFPMRLNISKTKRLPSAPLLRVFRFPRINVKRQE